MRIVILILVVTMMTSCQNTCEGLLRDARNFEMNIEGGNPAPSHRFIQLIP